MGRPVVHWELWSKDPGKLGAFYKHAFDWKVNHVEELNYHMVETGGDAGINGGIFTPQQGPWPAKLALYIDVDDLAAYRDRVRDAGGKVIVEEQEVPGVGRFCLFEDPDGRVMGMWQQAGAQ